MPVRLHSSANEPPRCCGSGRNLPTSSFTVLPWSQRITLTFGEVNVQSHNIKGVRMETGRRAEMTQRLLGLYLHGPAGRDVAADPPPLPDGAVEGGDVRVHF